MPDGTNTAPDAALDFALDEQWALHSAVLDHVERALENDDLPSPAVELTILEKIEAGEFRFTAFECERLRAVLADYAARDDAPEVDREPTTAALEQIDRQCPTHVPR